MIASLIWAAFPLGGTIGGFLNAYILANYGWPTIFWIGGALPLVVAVVLLLWLPESIRFLIADGRRPEAARAIARRIVPVDSPNAQIVADEQHMAGLALIHLFSEGRAANTLLLWIPFIMATLTLFSNLTAAAWRRRPPCLPSGRRSRTRNERRRRSKRTPSASDVSNARLTASFAASTEGSDIEAMVSATLSASSSRLCERHDARHEA
jgi:MFS family permease